MTDAFMILDISDSHNWPSRFADCAVIDPASRPTLLHTTNTSAETEALRLQRYHPGKRFAVFKATAVTVTVQAPTHVNLKGEVLQTTREARLADIAEELPF